MSNSKLTFKTLEKFTHSQKNFETVCKAIKASQPKAKCSVPTYSGDPKEDLDTFIFLLENNFTIDSTPDAQKIAIMVSYLRGTAIETYKRWKADRQILIYTDLKQHLESQFLPHDLQQKLRNKLAQLNVKQTKTFENYVMQFQNLLNKITHMNEQDKIFNFLRGLGNKTKAQVQFLTPQTLDDAIRLAAQYEHSFFPQDGTEPMDCSFAKSQSSYKRNYSQRKPFGQNKTYNNGYDKSKKQI